MSGTGRMSGSGSTSLGELTATIALPDARWAERAWARLDDLTKPPRSLGELETIAARVAAVQRTERPAVERKAVVLAAGDHGVVAEGVSPYPQEVTGQMVANFAAGGAAINQIADAVGAELVLLDVGTVGGGSPVAGLRVERVRPGTANMACGPAMTREEAEAAVLIGARVAGELAADGVSLLGTGEMGIGNTTAAAAVTAALTGVEPAGVVGRGTGLDDEGVARKADVVRRALDVNAVDSADPLGVLAAVGGLEIAALAGVVLGGARAGVCVVSDGFVSGAAALLAARMCPAASGYLFASHRSAEPGHGVILETLGLSPLFDLGMRLGEGTGAALAMPVIDAACSMMSGMATFSEAGVSDRAE